MSGTRSPLAAVLLGAAAALVLVRVVATSVARLVRAPGDLVARPETALPTLLLALAAVGFVVRALPVVADSLGALDQPSAVRRFAQVLPVYAVVAIGYLLYGYARGYDVPWTAPVVIGGSVLLGVASLAAARRASAR
jgi:hypothetical protein